MMENQKRVTDFRKADDGKPVPNMGNEPDEKWWATFTGRPSAVEWNDDVWVFFRGPKGKEHRLYFCIYVKKGGWLDGRFSVDSCDHIDGDPAAVVLENQIYVFYTGRKTGTDEDGDTRPLRWSKFFGESAFEYPFLPGHYRNLWLQEGHLKKVLVRNTTLTVTRYLPLKAMIFDTHPLSLTCRAFDPTNGGISFLLQVLHGPEPSPHASTTAVMFKGSMYIFYPGKSNGTTSQIQYQIWNGKNEWTAHHNIPGVVDTGSLSAASFNDTIWLVRSQPDGKVSYLTFDGEKWSKETILDWTTTTPPSAFAFKNTLFIWYGKKDGTENVLWFKKFAGTIYPAEVLLGKNPPQID